MLAVACAVPPDRVEEAVDRVTKLVTDEAREGPSADEMEAVRRQLVDLVSTAEGSPQYWANHLVELAYRGSSVRDLADAGELYRTCTAEQVRDALARWVDADHRLVVACRPET
jgi:predicted Zn-dependent peptidase